VRRGRRKRKGKKRAEKTGRRNRNKGGQALHKSAISQHPQVEEDNAEEETE
jgi:hypothetical protein